MSRNGLICVMLSVLVFTWGCDRKGGEGPAERIGREVDEAVEDMSGKAQEIADDAVEHGGKIADEAVKTVGDAGIRGKIKAKLAADAVLKVLRIEIEVKDGVVTLKGSVESEAQAENVEKIAKGTEGVKDVMNNLEVKAD